MDAKEFLLRIKRTGKTRKEIAGLLGCSLDTVNAYCKGKRDVPHEVSQKAEGWGQFVVEKCPMGDKVESVPIEKAVLSPTPPTSDFETGYIEITEKYTRSLGYEDFEKGKRAILCSRALGETRGKIAGHERWSK